MWSKNTGPGRFGRIVLWKLVSRWWYQNVFLRGTPEFKVLSPTRIVGVSLPSESRGWFVEDQFDGLH